MRRLIALGSLLCASCVGPHTTGALWAQQNLEREIELSRLSDAHRAGQAQAFERALADATLASERVRVTNLVADCPGATREPLAVSPGDRVRDGARWQAHDDQGRLMALARVALADWYARRASATGKSDACARARQALDASDPGRQTARPTVLQRLGDATVTRRADQGPQTSPDGPRVRVTHDDSDALTTLGLYALEFVDTVTAPAPLPHYLAAVYGGTVVGAANTADLGDQTPEEVVDDLAPATPWWEPDALYAALKLR